MADLAEFLQDSFDPVSWVNRACLQKPGDEQLERFLAELEMKLQLSAEEVEASLQECSAQALRRVPVAVQEIFRLQGEIQGLQDQVKTLLVQVERHEVEATSSVSGIAELDKVKRNVESACSTLREATELSEVFHKVEEVFETGELPQVANMLAGMRRSLALVGDVPEFKGGKEKLRVLEDRLQATVEVSLAEAFDKGNEDAVQKLCKMLLAVDRYGTVENLYTNNRLARVYAIWDGMQQQGDAATWLPRFFEQLLALMQQEAGFASAVLPSHWQQLLVTLLRATLTRVSKGLRERLGTTLAPQTLLLLQQDAVVLLRGLLDVLGGGAAATEQLGEVAALIFGPLEGALVHYGAMESRQLSSDLAGVLPTALDPSEDGAAAVQQLTAAVQKAFAILARSIERCMGQTGGTELAATLQAVDEQLLGMLGKLQAAVNELQLRARGESSTASASGQGRGQLLVLLLLGQELLVALGRLEGQARSAVAAAAAKLGALASRGVAAPLDLVAVRMALFGENRERLARLRSAAEDPRFTALPQGMAASDAFVQGLREAVLEALLQPVRSELTPFTGLACWASEAAGAGGLPSFHAYPQPYVTAIGEQLMSLPQELEVLMVTGAGDDGSSSSADELAAEWLDKVVSCAAAVLAEHIAALPALSATGAAQLAADVEYFTNVMGALHVATPANLLTAQLFLGQPAESFADVAAAAMADGQVDVATLRAVAKLRKMAVPGL